MKNKIVKLSDQLIFEFKNYIRRAIVLFNQLNCKYVTVKNTFKDTFYWKY